MRSLNWGRSPIFIFLLMFGLLAANCHADDKIKAVATFSILGDFVKQVGKDKVDVTVLVGPQADAHSFEPSPKDNIVLANAAIVFENGLHFEPWLDKLYTSSSSKAQRINVSEDVETIEINHAGNTETDPHIWQDVSNAMIMVEHIKNALISIDPSNSQYYEDNAQDYLAKLGDLNETIIDALKDISDEKRKLVTSHDTLGYFAKRYDFKIVGAAYQSATTEASDPSAASIAELVEKIKAEGVRAAFIENFGHAKVISAIAKEAGITLSPPLYTDALGPEGSAGDNYIGMMTYNAKTIAAVLTKDVL
jgi:zinc/manganese transport system substrate-binding protein